MKIRFSRKFVKQLEKTPAKIHTSFSERLRVFSNAPYSPLLNNHPLVGKLKGYRSINVTGDWRAIFSEDSTGIVFEMIGTHGQLYR